MKSAWTIGLLAAAACSAAPPVQGVDNMPDPTPEIRVPTGATIEPSGHATVLNAPPSPTKNVERYRGGVVSQEDWYAKENGISLAEAKKRMAEQQAAFPAYERLLGTLRAKEKGNFTAPRMIHQPDWAYVFYFKRDPAATLARYTANPHFKAAQARYTREELDALVKPWVERFGGAGILGGYGSDATYGEAQMMLSVSQDEYRELLKQVKWPALPDAIKLEFAAPLPVAAVDPRVAGLLRGFAHERRSTTIQLTAGFDGRIVLADGCLRLGNKAGPLVAFHRETGIGVDAQGYLALIDRVTGKAKARIGEMMSWAGPNEAKDFVGLEELKARCGGGPVANAGNPESKAVFDARYHRN